MVKTINALHETVSYKKGTHIMVYSNVQTDHYPLHWHTPVELLMPIENHYTAYINNKTYVVQPYEILFIAPNTIHRLEAPSTGHRYFIQADLNILKEIYGINQILSFIGSATLFTPSNSPEIYMQLKNLYLDICNEFFRSDDWLKRDGNLLSSHSSLCEPVVYSKLITMLSLIGRNYIESRNVEAVSPSRRQEYINKFMNICEYIDEHCTEDLTLEEISAMSGFSKYHFSRLFKEFTNVSFYKYVNQKRIATAEELLSNPNMTITEIALQSGFGSTSAFIRMFKLINSCTPTEFRRLRDSNPLPRQSTQQLSENESS